MKKYISIFELFARNTVYKILFVLLAMGAAQITMFQKAMSEWIPVDYYDLDFQGIEHYSLEYMVDKSNSPVFMGIAFVLITAILCWSGCNLGSKSSYTLQRLQVKEKTIFIMQCIYNSLCYVLLLGVQVAVLLVLCGMYVEQSDNVTNQTVFLAFYRNEFMHSVLPMEGMMRWIVNILILLGCGTSAAVFTYLQRRGKVAWSLFVVVACVLVGFIQELGGQLELGTAFSAVIIVALTVYYHVFQKKEDE